MGVIWFEIEPLLLSGFQGLRCSLAGILPCGYFDRGLGMGAKAHRTPCGVLASSNLNLGQVTVAAVLCISLSAFTGKGVAVAVWCVAFSCTSR